MVDIAKALIVREEREISRWCVLIDLKDVDRKRFLDDSPQEPPAVGAEEEKEEI
jgi:hypothetical protein